MHQRTPAIYDSMPNKKGILSKAAEKLLNGVAPSLLKSGSDKVLSQERVSYLKDSYKGETCYILTCGPSLNEVWSKELEEFLRDKLVIAVKQAFDLLPASCDFHLYNSVRLKEYSYPGPTIRISVWEYSNLARSHIHFPLMIDHSWDEAIIRTNRYEDYGYLEKKLERPLGTGIMFEVGLFLPVLLGCRRAVVLGFDMNQAGKYHFYRPDDSDSTNYARDGECQFAQESIHYYLDWANRQGLEVKAHSPLSALSIPQVEDIYNW